MNLRERRRLIQRVKEIEYIPLTGPDLDNAFYVFAIMVASNESVGRKKLESGRLYNLLEGFTVYNDRVLVSKERFQKTIYDYYDWTKYTTCTAVLR